LEENRSIFEKESRGTSSDELNDGRGRRCKSAKEAELLDQKNHVGESLAVGSRNQIVDNWLQIDQNTGQDEGLDDDAYADLANFLADGLGKDHSCQ
jgi:hypothetical protein